MKILLCGACGRMGREVASLAGEKIVCGVDRAPSSMPFPVYASFAEVREDIDVLIDFSSAEELEERLAFCASHGIPAVLGATGYSEADLDLIKRYSERIAIFKTGNLSVGVNLLQLLVKKAAEALGEDFDVEIIERHHNQKKDAPSGTALMLAESASIGSGGVVCGRHGITGPRKKGEIGIHAVRGGTIVGEHEVSFIGEDEIVTLAHSARSRRVFASGALKAAVWLLGKPAGLYDMNDMLIGIV